MQNMCFYRIGKYVMLPCRLLNLIESYFRISKNGSWTLEAQDVFVDRHCFNWIGQLAVGVCSLYLRFLFTFGQQAKVERQYLQ